MSLKLTEFERITALQILEQEGTPYSMLIEELPRLKVVDRTPTGVGCYVTFDSSDCKEVKCPDVDIGLRNQIPIKDVMGGIGADLAIENGRLDYLELFTCGDEQWDGNTDLTFDSMRGMWR